MEGSLLLVMLCATSNTLFDDLLLLAERFPHHTGMQPVSKIAILHYEMFVMMLVFMPNVRMISRKQSLWQAS